MIGEYILENFKFLGNINSSADLKKLNINELEVLADAIVAGKDLHADKATALHADWVDGFRGSYGEINSDNVTDILHAEVGKVFATVLEHAGVFKRTPDGEAAFMRFIESI